MSIFTAAGFDQFASALEATTLHNQWGSRLAKIGGKIYAVYSEASIPAPTIAFKCSRESFEVLTAVEGIGQAPYFARGQWVAASAIANLPEEELCERIALSYQIVRDLLPRKQLSKLGLVATSV